MLARRVFSMVGAIIAASVAISEAGAQPAPAPLPPRLETMRARGEMAVCIWSEYFGISFRNPRTNELEGLDIDMARALAQRLNLRVRFVETSFLAFTDRLEAGDCDIAMMGVGITPARAQRVAFSRPVMSSPLYGVIQRGNTRVRSWADIDQRGIVAAVAAGTAAEPLMRQALRRAELMVVTPPRTREAEVLAGRADVFITDYAYAHRMGQMHDWAVVIEPPDRFGETLQGWAVPLHDPAWLAEVNSFQSAVRADGSLARAAARHGLAAVLLR